MLVRALCAVKLTASGHTCARLAAPVSLPESDTAEVAEQWRGIAGFEPALTAPEVVGHQSCNQRGSSWDMCGRKCRAARTAMPCCA